ncbi:hypothetical protein [Mycobacterium sp. 852002-40037_SCH5390672]|uniref:hypothetical protein n=1 Tax=Mycobacterium sp. 852002-40037_SCH5390672 TaxID=1834089 RepID=UPI0012E74753|nr:hypothetical protein [Mycobacterium sp. 852002-40037_SCH5390672]
MRRAAVVQYFTTQEGAQRNRALIEDVLIELAARDPGGGQYQVLMSDDGLGFVHVVAFDGTVDPFADCAAHREFHRELAHRLATKPVVTRAVLIGSYHGRAPGATLRRPQR